MSTTPGQAVWVDVADRLPDFGRRVLVWGDWSRDGYRCPVAVLRNHASDIAPFWSREDGQSVNGVSHWWDGPLPEWAKTPARRVPRMGSHWDVSPRRPGEKLATDTDQEGL